MISLMEIFGHERAFPMCWVPRSACPCVLDDEGMLIGWLMRCNMIVWVR